MRGVLCPCGVTVCLETSLGVYQTLQAGDPDSLLVVSGGDTGIPHNAGVRGRGLVGSVGGRCRDADNRRR